LYALRKSKYFRNASHKSLQPAQQSRTPATPRRLRKCYHVLHLLPRLGRPKYKPWCPDVVAAIPHLEEVFSAPGSPDVAFVEVGQKPEYVLFFSYSSILSPVSQVSRPRMLSICRWRDLSNVYRTKWNVNNVPTLVRFENVNGTVNETGRLVEGDILDRKKLGEFVLKEPGNAGA
jgi:thiol-disulfide isomerase/thioredoxin